MSRLKQPLTDANRSNSSSMTETANNVTRCNCSWTLSASMVSHAEVPLASSGPGCRVRCGQTGQASDAVAHRHVIDKTPDATATFPCEEGPPFVPHLLPEGGAVVKTSAPGFEANAKCYRTAAAAASGETIHQPHWFNLCSAVASSAHMV